MKNRELIDALKALPDDVEVRLVTRSFLDGDPDRYIITEVRTIAAAPSLVSYGDGSPMEIRIPICELFFTT